MILKIEKIEKLQNKELKWKEKKAIKKEKLKITIRKMIYIIVL